MDQPVSTLTSERADAGKWMGRIVIAVILGEAAWNLIVSVMNNLIVPWVGDFIGAILGIANIIQAASLQLSGLVCFGI